MSQWNLSEIRKKTRQLSGRLSIDELDNDLLDDYINKYFQFEFPAEVKLNRNYSFYEFHTKAKIRDYDFSTDFTNFVPLALIDEQAIDFYQDPDDFENQAPMNVSRFSTWTGDGTTVSFSTTYSSNATILAGSVLVEDTVEIFTDDSAGVLTGDQGGSGTVDYDTGVLSVTFNTAPTSGQVVYSSFIRYSPGSPTSVLMFNNIFRFYPTPDKAYRFKIKGWSLLYVKPVSGANKTTFDFADDKPVQEEWGPAIAFGASRRIASDYGEMDRYAELTSLYKEQIDYILTRTHVDLELTRARPQF